MTSWVTSNPSLHGASEARGKLGQNVAPLAKASVGKAARGMMSPTSSAAEPKFFNFIWTAFLPVPIAMGLVIWRGSNQTVCHLSSIMTMKWSAYYQLQHCYRH